MLPLMRGKLAQHVMIAKQICWAILDKKGFEPVGSKLCR